MKKFRDALPDSRDGLKPLERQVLFVLFLLGLEHGGTHVDASLIVKEVMERFNQHNELLISQTIAKLANQQISHYPLVYGKPSLLSLDDRPVDFVRQNKIALTAFGVEIFQNLGFVLLKPNFMPSVLPTRLPFLLLNGSYGTAIGIEPVAPSLKSWIPPHNLNEIIDALQAQIDSGMRLQSEELMKYIKGPDFPGAGLIVGSAGIEDLYLTGRGNIIHRGDASIEQLPGPVAQRPRTAIVVTSLPYLVSRKAFLRRLTSLHAGTEIPEIAAIRDESKESNLRIVIELEYGSQAEQVIERLYNLTSLEKKIGFQLGAMVLANQGHRRQQSSAENNEMEMSVPLEMQLHHLINEFIDHRKQVIAMESGRLREDALLRAHLKEGLITALNNLERVRKILANANVQDVKHQLITSISLTESQSAMVTKIGIKALSQLNSSTLKHELNELQNEIATYEKILSSSHQVNEILKQQLRECGEKYGDERRTRITTTS